VVEVQLMREVQLRSSSIFDAASEVDALNQLVRFYPLCVCMCVLSVSVYVCVHVCILCV